MAAAAVTHGHLTLRDIIPAHLGPVIPVMEEAGCDISICARDLTISAPPRLHRVHTVRTMPYPGFPTDAQAPVMAMTAIADGTSVIIENIFESRYKHVSELMRLGAHIKVEGRVAVVEGVPFLSGAPGGGSRSAGRFLAGDCRPVCPRQHGNHRRPAYRPGI